MSPPCTSWLEILGCVSAFLLGCWILLYLWSLRTTYSLKGKHILITGGSSGIGKAVAAEALKRGVAIVTLVARNEEKLRTAKEELERLVSAKVPQQVLTISCDVTSSSVKEDIPIELSGYPPVDVLVNSAGISHTGSFQDTSTDVFQEQFRVNVVGSVLPTQALLPAMVSRKQGRIVFISSMAGQMALCDYTAYSASKYAVRGLAEVLDMELRAHNIRVSVSYPPETNTPMLQSELKLRSAVQKAQAKFGSVFEADSIARDICRGIERGQFQINHGFDGFLLGTITTGMSPEYHTASAITQVLTMGLLRMVGFVYIKLFYRIAQKQLEKEEKSK